MEFDPPIDAAAIVSDAVIDRSLTSAPVDGLFHLAGPNCEHSKSLLEHDIYGDEMNACAGAVSPASKEGQGHSVPLFSQPVQFTEWSSQNVELSLMMHPDRSSSGTFVSITGRLLSLPRLRLQR
jgi:hypothetical protein